MNLKLSESPILPSPLLLQLEADADVVSVYFSGTSAPLVNISGSLTGQLPGPFMSPEPTGIIIIRFVTDLSLTMAGFSLIYESIPIPPARDALSSTPSPVATTSVDSDVPVALVVGLTVGLSAAVGVLAIAGLLVWRCRRAGPCSSALPAPRACSQAQQGDRLGPEADNLKLQALIFCVVCRPCASKRYWQVEGPGCGCST
jgi:hypothetical protein